MSNSGYKIKQPSSTSNPGELRAAVVASCIVAATALLFAHKGEEPKDQQAPSISVSPVMQHEGSLVAMAFDPEDTGFAVRGSNGTFIPPQERYTITQNGKDVGAITVDCSDKFLRVEKFGTSGAESSFHETSYDVTSNSLKGRTFTGRWANLGNGDQSIITHGLHSSAQTWDSSMFCTDQKPIEPSKTPYLRVFLTTQFEQPKN